MGCGFGSGRYRNLGLSVFAEIWQPSFFVLSKPASSDRFDRRECDSLNGDSDSSQLCLYFFSRVQEDPL